MTDKKIFGLRLPEDVRKLLKASAERNMRSQNAEITVILREKLLEQVSGKLEVRRD